MTSKLNKHNIWFPRYEEGNIDVKTGKYDTNNQPKNATFKYEKEGWFCLGVAKTESKNGTITGKLCPIFDYLGENIVTIDAYNKINTEIICRSSKAYFIIFTIDKRKKKTDKVWLCESVGKLKGVGQQEKSKMNHGTPKVPIWGFGRIYDISLRDLLGNSPTYSKYHRKATNLDLSRYGERWVDKLKSSTAMSKFCCITNLIHFVMNESEKLMKGSVNKDDFSIVHDSLVLMT